MWDILGRRFDLIVDISSKEPGDYGPRSFRLFSFDLRFKYIS